MPSIKGLRRLEHTTRRTGGSGDNWHMTWAPDDRQYVALCDGRGWPEIIGHVEKDYNTRVYALLGDPPNPVFEHLPDYPDLLTEEPPNVNRYYGFGILAVGQHIIHYLSTPNHPFTEPEARFVGVKLVYSPNLGRTWHNVDGSTPVRWENWTERNRGNMLFFEEDGETFSLITCLQMGCGYELNQDGYVYLYAPNGNLEGTMNQLVLARVPIERVLDRMAYEFFVSRRPDGSAQWSPHLLDRGVVHTFPAGWVNTKVHPYAWHPSVVYYAPLGIFLMANWGMGCTDDGTWFGKPSYLGFWTAPQPWGPWEQVYEETAWIPLGDPEGRAYQPQISPKWIAPDGKSFWLVFTEFRPGWYCFNYQQVEVWW
ncbi:MAG: DUF4185 domain-containing protein [Candidatus Zipacnadales bacterium]